VQAFLCDATLPRSGLDNPVVSGLVSGWLLPPFNALLLLAAGLVVCRWRRRLGLMLVVLGTLLLYVCSAPFVAVASIRALEVPAAGSLEPGGAGAIVVLTAGTYLAAPEYGSDVPTAAGLERMRYAAFLQRRTGLPVLVTGGAIVGAAIPEAVQMRAVLEEELHIPVRWAEPTGTTTWSSAAATRAMLAGEGIDRIVLVTHSWHMRRAMLAFEHAGFTVIPAPTGFATYSPDYPPGLIPTTRALDLTRNAWREALGIGWYALRSRLVRRSNELH